MVPVAHPMVASMPPMRDGVSPSCVALPGLGAGTMLDFLDSHFPSVGRTQWQQRMQAGDVVDIHGAVVMPQRPFEPHLRLYYYRDVANEPEIPFTEQVLYQDAHLLVADKPHFLPVMPAGRYLRQTLLVRLKQRLGLPELSPLHRIDRDTAGLVLFSVQKATRGLYQSLFRQQAIHKEYEAVAPWRPELQFPREHQSRLQESGQFFLMHEVAGRPNSHTYIELLEQAGNWARYRLYPITGKRHQLRVHMAALGLPLRYDAFYPQVIDPPEGDFSRPLQLLARTLALTDPITGKRLHFMSQRQLLPIESNG